MSRKRLDPNVVAEWIGTADAAERALQSGTGTARAAALWEIAQGRGTTEPHVRRLVNGWRFIQSVRAGDRELAKCLERSSYNLTEIISRWHPRDPQAASKAARQYHAGELTLAQLRSSYDIAQQHGVLKPGAPPAADYLGAVRVKIEEIEPWIQGVEPTPRPFPPFGEFDLHFRGEGARELGVIVLPPRQSAAEQNARFTIDAGLILLAHHLGLTPAIAGPKGEALDRYSTWTSGIGLDRCRIIALERVVREVWM